MMDGGGRLYGRVVCYAVNGCRGGVAANCTLQGRNVEELADCFLRGYGNGGEHGQSEEKRDTRHIQH